MALKYCPGQILPAQLSVLSRDLQPGWSWHLHKNRILKHSLCMFKVDTHCSVISETFQNNCSIFKLFADRCHGWSIQEGQKPSKHYLKSKHVSDVTHRTQSQSLQVYQVQLCLIQEFLLYHLWKEVREAKSMVFLKSKGLGLNPGSSLFNSYVTFDLRENTNHLKLNCTCKHSGMQ